MGGLFGGFVVVGMTLVLKSGIDFVGAQKTWMTIAVPLLGLLLTGLVLHGIGRSGREPRSWRTFAPGAVRADITGDVVASAGEEEHFPWRLAPLRSVAALATVGLGNAMGTEAPAAYFGVAAGAALGDRGRRWRRMLRPMALGGGAAGVAALMGHPLVGTAYVLELGRRHHAPLSTERLLAALIGGVIGWGIDVVFGLSLIRLVVPHEAPRSFAQGLVTALFIGALSGLITALAGSAIYRAKKWRASPVVRFLVGGLAVVATALLLAWIATPSTAVGPGGGAIVWAENVKAVPLALLAVALLRGVATTAATAAGGCGGIFVPFLAVGDLAGRVFAPGLGIGDDLAGSAGAAGGIAGGYRLPVTAVAMVLGVGGPRLATLTSLGAVAVAYAAAVAADAMLARLKRLPPPRPRAAGGAPLGAAPTATSTTRTQTQTRTPASTP
ncbi:MAG TPA: chloride channel protein [Polyangia bacterium]|nr:chloride channel protein [Polyangia bacterium]